LQDFDSVDTAVERNAHHSTESTRHRPADAHHSGESTRHRPADAHYSAHYSGVSSRHRLASAIQSTSIPMAISEKCFTDKLSTDLMTWHDRGKHLKVNKILNWELQ